MAKAGTGSGTVTSSPAGINCGADCSAPYDPGTVVTLAAAPAAESSFVGWSGACTGTASCQVTMDAAMAVTATFNPRHLRPDRREGRRGRGTVTSSPAGIICGADCSELYNSGTVVTLTAAPTPGSAFAGWSGACTGATVCQVTMDAAKSVTATFTTPAFFTLTLSLAGDGTGTVTSTPAGIACGADCSEDYATGTAVTLTPTPAGGSVFVSWGGACAGTASCRVTMDAARLVTATFAVAMYPLTVSTTGSGSGAVHSSPAGIACGADCSEPFDHGTVVYLAAFPEAGSSFGGWSGACFGAGPCQVTMDAPKSVAVIFETGGPFPPGDLNRDGWPDLLWHNQLSGSLYASFLVNGAATSGSYLQPDHVLRQPDHVLTRNWEVRGLADLDGDTHTDLLWQDARTGALAASLMNATQMLRLVSISRIGLPAPRSVPRGPRRREIWQVRGLADIDGDGRNDAIWHHPQSGELFVWFMNGTTPRTGAAFGSGPLPAAEWQPRGFADFNGDGHVDVLWQKRGTGDLYISFMNGTTAVGGAYTTPARPSGPRWQIVRVSDLNEDGKPDLVWQHQTTGELYAWYMSGAIMTSSSSLTPSRPSGTGWRVAPQ